MAKDRVRYEDAIKKGEAFNTEKLWKQAIGAFRVAVGEFPNEPEPYAGLGIACLGLKQLDKALDCFKLASRYSKGDISYLQRVADIQERMGQLSEAGRTYMAIGEIQLRHNQIDSAVDNWLRAVGLESELLGAHRRLAMVFQRQNNIKGAVREYLAIARILQMQGEKDNALQMCRAALRLDPDSKDVITAMELIKHGEKALAEEEEEEEEAKVEEAPAETGGDDLASAVRQIASIFESEKKGWQMTQDQARKQLEATDPIEAGKKLALEQLSEEIFREEEDEDILYGTGGVGLSKLEQDALIGQAMDFQSRNDFKGAVSCYEKAVKGGLKLTAAYFSLGLMYVELKQAEKARQVLQLATQDSSYQAASKALLAKLG